MDDYGYKDYEDETVQSEVATQVLAPLASGKFALYKTPEGGMHMTLKLDGDEETRHFDVPSFVLKMLPKMPGLGL